MELLVSIAILTVLVLLLAQMMASVLSVTVGGHRRMDADSQGRLVLDRLAYDFERMIKRTDVDYTFQNINPGALNATSPGLLSFYATTPSGSSSTRSLSVIGYQMNADYQLERGAENLEWTSASNLFVPFVAGVQTQQMKPPNTLPVLPEAKYQVLGDQVFRFDFCYLVRGATSSVATTLKATPPARIGDLMALVVAVAVLDQTSRLQLSTAQLGKMAILLPAAHDGQDLANGTNGWDAVVTAGTFAKAAGVPVATASAVRVYQRSYFLQ